MHIGEEDVAKSFLLEVGYFRLGFYWHYFEEKGRLRPFKSGTSFEKVMRLYNLDAELRSILMRHASALEVAFRASLVYLAGDYYGRPQWFVMSQYMKDELVDSFDEKVYSAVRRAEVIRNHHKRHPNDRYAPACKTFEFVTFGSALRTYSAIKSTKLKMRICERFRVPSVEKFERQLEAVCIVRNACAHGNVIYDLGLPRPLDFGVLSKGVNGLAGNVGGAVVVLMSLLEAVNPKYSKSVRMELLSLLDSEVDLIEEAAEYLRRLHCFLRIG